MLNLIFLASLTYPLVHEIQVVQPQHSARDLGPSIAIGEKQQLFINSSQSQINPAVQLQLNSKTSSEEETLSNSRLSTKSKEIKQKSGQIDSLSTEISIGSVKSELELNSQDIQTEMTLFSESGFSFKMKKEFRIRDLKPKIEPVLSFKKSLNWFQDYSKNKPKDKKVSLQQAMKFGVSRRLKFDSPYLRSLKIDRSARINQDNEINDFSKDIEDLRKSLNSSINSQFGTSNATFSLEADLEDLSAKLKLPIPGSLSDELEFKIKTNLLEVLVDGEDLQDNMKPTLSLRYGIDINDDTKLKIQSSYDLHKMTYQIIWTFWQEHSAGDRLLDEKYFI